MVLILAICITAVRQIVYIFVSIFLLNLSFKHGYIKDCGFWIVKGNRFEK